MDNFMAVRYQITGDGNVIGNLEFAGVLSDQQAWDLANILADASDVTAGLAVMKSVPEYVEEPS